MSKITVYRYSPYTIEKKKELQINGNDCSVSFFELRSWIRSGAIFSHLLRYRDSVMVNYDLGLIAKPFASALLTKALSHKSCSRVDRHGHSEKITFLFLVKLFIRLIRDFFGKKPLLRRIKKQIESLKQPKPFKKKLDLTQPPVYLRTDFCFGLQSGGSVGHIAGVLNHLSEFAPKPIFLSTDTIPTVRTDLETHIIRPGTHFWDFSELPPLDFNEIFTQQALKILESKKPSFVYQRYSINNFSGIQISNHFQIPFVLEFNGSETWVNRNWGDNRLKYEALANEIELLNIKASDLVVVVSQPIKDQLITKGIEADKILVNPNGVNPEKYSPSISGKAIREKYNLQDKIVIGFIGTFGTWHGAEVLAKAFEKLLKKYPELKPKTMLLMIGDGIMMPEVKRILSVCKENCVFTGTVAQELGPNHMAACDLLISPHVPNKDGTPFFGSPTKLFEYMAMGKGIVASNLDQIGEILQHDRTAWMVEPGNADSLMKGMKGLIDNPELRARLGQAARKEACSKYSWKEHTKKILDRLSLSLDRKL